MNDTDITRAWGAVAPILEKFSFYDIKNIVRLTGDIEPRVLKYLGYDDFANRDKSNAELISEVEGRFLDFSDDKQHQFLNIVIEEILSDRFKFYGDDDPEKILHYWLNRLGWQIIDKNYCQLKF